VELNFRNIDLEKKTGVQFLNFVVIVLPGEYCVGIDTISVTPQI
jgi:hypothetical protein